MIRTAHYIRCDICEDEEHTALTARTVREALRSARDFGWARRRTVVGPGVTALVDVCPDCQGGAA